MAKFNEKIYNNAMDIVTNYCGRGFLKFFDLAMDNDIKPTDAAVYLAKAAKDYIFQAAEEMEED